MRLFLSVKQPKETQRCCHRLKWLYGAENPHIPDDLLRESLQASHLSHHINVLQWLQQFRFRLPFGNPACMRLGYPRFQKEMES